MHMQSQSIRKICKLVINKNDTKVQNYHIIPLKMLSKSNIRIRVRPPKSGDVIGAANRTQHQSNQFSLFAVMIQHPSVHATPGVRPENI